MTLLISADSHVVEPIDLWERHLGRRFGERVPRKVVGRVNGEDGVFFVTGSSALSESVRRDPTKTDEENRDMNLAGADPRQRVKCMDTDGVAAEVLHTTRGLYFFRCLEDRDLLRACCQVYNDWLADYCSHDPRRLIGVGMIPLDDVGWAVGELERISRKGLRGVMINTAPPGRPPLRDAAYDPFWAVCEERAIPITLHVGQGVKDDPFSYQGAKRRESPGALLEVLWEGGLMLSNDFLFGGIFDRFPRLLVSLAEFECSWAPSFIAVMNNVQDGMASVFRLPPIKQRTMDYFRQNILLTFLNDPYAGIAARVIGADRLAWASDFPHVRNPYPRSHESFAKLLADSSLAERELMAGQNVKKIYRIEL